jgi:TolB-like protein
MKKIIIIAVALCAVLIAAICAASCATGGASAGTTVPLDTAIREAAANIENRLAPGANVALLSFSSPSEAFSEYVLEELSGFLVNGGKLVVVDRKKLDLIRQEEAFQLSGEVSDESAQAIGKKLGAQFIVTGGLSSVGKHYRFRVNALTVETAVIAAAASQDISAGEQKTASLLAGAKPRVEALSEEPVPEGLLYEAVGGKSVTITKYIGSAASVTIPASIGGLPVTVIGENAFSNYKSLTSVTIPLSVTTIGGGAFVACSGLTRVTIPSSVTTIGGGAFYGCWGLTSVAIPSLVTSIGYGAFAACDNLTNISVDPGNGAYTSVSGVLFDKAGKTLVCYPAGKKGAYTVPSSVTTIGVQAFDDCKSLTSVKIPYGVTTIGEAAFYFCTGLTSVDIPSSVTTIGDGAFAGAGLTRVTVTMVITIGEEAFAGTFLTSVDIPSSVTSIGDGAFLGCSRLTSVTLSRRTRMGAGAFGSGVRIQYRD